MYQMGSTDTPSAMAIDSSNGRGNGVINGAFTAAAAGHGPATRMPMGTSYQEVLNGGNNSTSSLEDRDDAMVLPLTPSSAQLFNQLPLHTDADDENDDIVSRLLEPFDLVTQDTP